jgi:putative ABC transport system permease protein
MKIYVMFAFRNLLNRPFLHFIKIVGLSLALSSILVIVLYMNFELSFDRYHKKADRIYRFTVTNSQFFNGRHFARTHNVSYIPELKNQYPEIINYTRLLPIRGNILKYDDRYVDINQAFECDSTFFQVFDAELVIGNKNTVLHEPGSMVITESFAKKVFGNTNPVGQILTIPPGQYYGRDYDYTVKGVMKDFPGSSHFHPDLIASALEENFQGWAWTYLLLSEGANPGKIEAGFKDFYISRHEGTSEEISIQAHLQKLTDIHLHSDKLREIEANSNMLIIYTLCITILILLLISLTNYANLNIGMTEFTNKFHFVSRVSGSSCFTKLNYFITENIILILFTLVLTAIFAMSTHFIIRKYVGLNLFSGNILLIFVIVFIFSLVSVFTGIAHTFKHRIQFIGRLPGNRFRLNQDKKGINKGLIVLQYAISIILIVAVFMIHQQTQFALKKSIGGTSDTLICLEEVHSNVQKKFELFKEELLKHHSIESVSAALEPPGGEINDAFRFEMEGYMADETLNSENRIRILPCDYSFASIFELEFLSGGNFTKKNVDNEGSGEYIVNEAAVKYLQHTSPDEIIDKKFQLIWNSDAIKIPEGRIIGVVKNFHFSSLKKEIEPLVLFKRDALWLRNYLISFRAGMQAEGLADLKKVWNNMFPGYPFHYEYVSSMFRKVYKPELLQSRLLSIFSVIALFICSMGLLGLTLLSIQRRTKEIGVRKVNGAQTGEILAMLNVDLIKWIIISFLIAIPLAYLAMNKWLENFAYKAEMSWWIFGLAGMIVLGIALLTVSFQSYRAAIKNPVESLRYE